MNDVTVYEKILIIVTLKNILKNKNEYCFLVGKL